MGLPSSSIASKLIDNQRVTLPYHPQIDGCGILRNELYILIVNNNELKVVSTVTKGR